MGDALDAPVLFHWPASAAYGRAVPKTKFYEHGNVRAALREKFVDEVQRIAWAYKLADDTVRMRGSAAVPEIQVFAIEAKGSDVSNDVVSAIDKAIHFPIIFEVLSGERVRTVAALKSLGGKTPTIGEYYSTDWQPADAARRPMPTALDLPGLYEAILSALLPVAVRAGETVSEASARLDSTRKIEREIAALEKKLRAEPQLNRKIELRRQIKERTAVLADLADAVTSSKG